MMDLTHTLSVEHADAQSDGCVWHGDPACLCDVIVTEPMRDDDYDVAPWIEEMFATSDTDEWFVNAWDLVVGRTLLATCADEQVTHGEVLAMLDNEPLVKDLLAGMTAAKAAAKHKVSLRCLLFVRKYLNLRTHGKHAQGIRNRHLRQHVIERHFQGGEKVIDIMRDLQSKGVAVPKEVTLYQWVARERTERAAA